MGDKDEQEIFIMRDIIEQLTVRAERADVNADESYSLMQTRCRKYLDRAEGAESERDTLKVELDKIKEMICTMSLFALMEDNERLRAAFKKSIDLGHYDECLFCGFKDKLAYETLGLEIPTTSDKPCKECGGSGIKKQKDFKVRMIPVDGDVITGSVKTNVPCQECGGSGKVPYIANPDGDSMSYGMELVCPECNKAESKG